MRDTPSKPSCPRAGFTLVELLVVIGVIAVLIAMLLPALSKVRDQAKAVVCSSNMHQLHLAVLYYSQSNRNRHCLYTSVPPDAGTNWHRTLWPYVGPREAHPDDWVDMYQMIRSSEGTWIYRCPADTVVTNWHEPWFSYAMNSNTKDQSFRQRVWVMLFMDFNIYLSNGFDSNLTFYWPYGRHTTSHANLCFEDGHVERRDRRGTRDRVQEPRFWGLAP